MIETMKFAKNLTMAQSRLPSKAFKYLAWESPASLEIEGKRYRKVEPSIGQALTLFGPVAFNRSRYRPSIGRGECFIPAEHVLGLLDGDLTSAPASLSMMLLSSLTVRESADIWERICAEGPSVSTLCRLTVDVGRCMEECSDQMMAALRTQEELPENAAILHASLDGVMMRMNERKQGDNVIEQGAGVKRRAALFPFLIPRAMCWTASTLAVCRKQESKA